MSPILQKTFGGLTKQYYFRQLFFGAALSAFLVYVFIQGSEQNPEHQISETKTFFLAVFLVISTLLYPYSRFVYESVVRFVMGENVFFVNAVTMLITKIITIAICLIGAVWIAPIGLAYLYYHHSKEEKRVSEAA